MLRLAPVPDLAKRVTKWLRSVVAACFAALHHGLFDTFSHQQDVSIFIKFECIYTLSHV